jgi:hypothetical protein
MQTPSSSVSSSSGEGEHVTGKDKSSRVPLDYFRGSSKSKWIAALVVTCVVVAGLVASLASGYWRELSSPGKLHTVHAAWEQDCSACHAVLQPTSSRNGLRATLGAVSDQLCQKCHEGPPHHGAHEGTCASCHVEHRGRHSQLALVPDSRCTNCHADLAAHLPEPLSRNEPWYANHITSFVRDHPQFHLGADGHRQPLGKTLDPGALKFNHQAHLTAGVRLSKKDGGGWTLGHIEDPSLRERYRKEQPPGKDKDTDLVQLDCASCHQLDATDAPTPGPGQGPALRTTGYYLQPTSYEQHCKACHPLTFRPDLLEVEVPHLLQPPQVRRFLWGVFTEQEVKDKGQDKKPLTDRPLPGQNLTRLEKEARERIKGKVAQAEKFLFQEDLGKAVNFMFTGKTTCGLCHFYKEKPGDQTPVTIRPVNVPQVWYPHARFSHKAHRAVQCQDCHDGASKSTKSSDILLPGIENCRTCHAPSSSVAGEKRGGVRHDCATCHRYHQGEVAEAGPGTKARGVKERRPWQEFLAPGK